MNVTGWDGGEAWRQGDTWSAIAALLKDHESLFRELNLLMGVMINLRDISGADLGELDEKLNMGLEEIIKR